jgi:hypothetical protein
MWSKKRGLGESRVLEQLSGGSGFGSRILQEISELLHLPTFLLFYSFILFFFFFSYFLIIIFIIII